MKVTVSKENLKKFFPEGKSDLRYLTVYDKNTDELKVAMSPRIRGKQKLTILVYEVLRSHWRYQQDTIENAVEIVKATEELVAALWRAGYRE